MAHPGGAGENRRRRGVPLGVRAGRAARGQAPRAGPVRDGPDWGARWTRPVAGRRQSLQPRLGVHSGTYSKINYPTNDLSSYYDLDVSNLLNIFCWIFW